LHTGYCSVEPSADDPAAAFYSAFIRPGDLCFDVGANLGDRTRVFRTLGARVVSIEPQRDCLEQLRHEFASDPGVVVVGKALAAQVGQAQIAIGHYAVHSTLSDQWVEIQARAGVGWSRVETVETVRLDDLIDEHGMPSFLKIDVEGYEEEVLKGLSFAPPSLSFEFQVSTLDWANRCFHRLESLASYQYNYTIEESFRLELPNWVGPADLMDSLSRFAGAPFHYGDVYARIATAD
jgi:FkbM family methyltransferase